MARKKKKIKVAFKKNFRQKPSTQQDGNDDKK